MVREIRRGEPRRRQTRALDVRTGYREDIFVIRTVDRLLGAAYREMKMLLSRRYLMSELFKVNMLRNFVGVETSGGDAVMGDGRSSARKLARLGVAAASGLLLAALCAVAFAPAANGQTAAGAAASGTGTAPAQTAASGKPLANAATQPAAVTAPTSTQESNQAPAPKSTDAAAPSEPQMQNQSAPPAESLGEAARRARAQKAKTATAKVYSDDSVSTLSGHGVSVVGDGKAGGGSSYSGNSYSSGGGAAQGSAGSQEAYWRGRANAIRSQMAACDQKISEIQDEIAKHGAVTVDPMSGAQAGVIFVEDRNAQIQQVQKQKEGFERQLEDLAEEGRKGGADSGWFR